MIDPTLMNALLANQLFRACLAARTIGIEGDHPLQKAAATRVTNQIAKVRERTPGSFRYNMANGALLQHLDAYLRIYNETEPPYLPKGVAEASES
jgi:hypothetical protein